ncbi:hypothetical protein [Parashewanella curva]|uniref:hypothetical protein n=1 Tax=Parashewanella curva TaxID=2338552 RepID=UPI001404E04C|nr:hypothetical protein [Parashewanella curva]
MKKFLSLCFILFLTHCSSLPKPPHCKDDGKGLKPVNTQPIVIKPIEVRHG